MFRFLVLCVFVLAANVASAERRVALLIGNDAYTDVPPLLKAVADAEAIAATMAGLGFETVLATDASRREMNLAVANFTALLGPGDTAFVFYAGHGVEIEGENYLLPVDILVPGAASADFVRAESISLSDLLDRVRATGAKATLAVVDACRNNPFPPDSAGRSLGGTRGLARVAAPEGTFVMFSAGAGQLALDRLDDNDTNANSVFTRTLLPKLQEPGLELRDMISQVRVDVRDLARTRNHAQFPAYYDELLGDFYFTEASSRAVAPSDGPVALPSDLPELAGMGAVASRASVDDVMTILQSEISALGGRIYSVIDHKDAAARVERSLPDARLIIFGDPRLDALAVQDNVLAGLLVPQRMLVYDHKGTTIIAYEYPEEVFDDLSLGDNTQYLDLMQSLSWAVAGAAAR